MTQPTPAEQLLNLADRGPLTGDEAARLRESISQLYADLDWARRQALAAQQEATEAVTRAERAEAALANVCAECARAALDEHQEQQ